MKITHICLCGPTTDGFSYQENVITKYHKKSGNEVTIIASEWLWGSNGELVKTDKTDYINSDGVKVIRLPIRYGDITTKLKTYKNLTNTLLKEMPDIIFIHGCQFLDIRTFAKFAKKNKNVKIYIDNHVDYSNGAKNWLSKNILHKIVWKHCVKSIIPHTEKFYGVLPARVDILSELYKIPPDKCELLVMGADDELVESAKAPQIRAEIREKYGIAQDDFLIMFGGKIDIFKKQILLLMDAVNEIENDKLKLLVFGSCTEELKDDVAARTSEKVQYIGWVNSADSYPLFAAADLACFPGRHSVFWEQVTGQGIPMLVKYLDGTTHVDLGGNVEFLYEDSKEEIKQKIEELLLNPEKYNTMKNVAQQKGMEHFSYKNIAKRAICQDDI